ncbi:TetR/AcrR family transcriptional regulator [Paenibacillus alginolyticus]|uniref:TetR/AcrR family transcriptional regulator n=1 Tax=Paenibacillus alginolyticus TaxID=59839 RepID=A0ABT4GI49_9BACL|nr:TetR/AcrR family transcriptional regulator [Paenibacillus alginolyticus]MCY9695724.1 TetR/AcrR family transcriptional regulator [Paenibacillus alginolyticus]MEC0142262.1 TetR/AcrR family transcriptional regulator [Paenibacillus alginolyticus]
MSKEKIIQTAVEVFSENGYHRASMDEIALRANVAKGTLYYHFPGKAQLFKTLVKDGFQEIIDKVQADLKANLTLEEQIKRIIRHNLDLFLESSRLAHIVFNELSNGIDQEVLEELKKLRIDYIHFLASVLEEGKHEGVLRDVNCNLAAAGIVGMLDSACNYFLNNKHEGSRDQIEQFFYTIITSGLFLTSGE